MSEGGSGCTREDNCAKDRKLRLAAAAAARKEAIDKSGLFEYVLRFIKPSDLN